MSKFFIAVFAIVIGPASSWGLGEDQKYFEVVTTLNQELNVKLEPTSAENRKQVTTSVSGKTFWGSDCKVKYELEYESSDQGAVFGRFWLVASKAGSDSYPELQIRHLPLEEKRVRIVKTAAKTSIKVSDVGTCLGGAPFASCDQLEMTALFSRDSKGALRSIELETDYKNSLAFADKVTCYIKE